MQADQVQPLSPSPVCVSLSLSSIAPVCPFILFIHPHHHFKTKQMHVFAHAHYGYMDTCLIMQLLMRYCERGEGGEISL